MSESREPSVALAQREQPDPQIVLGSGRMFDAIAERYDFLNRVISLGIDQGWRRRTVKSLALRGSPGRVLDVATGTADLAILTARMEPRASIVGLDPSANMLAVGRTKVAGLGLASRIDLVEGDAQALPYPDDTFDGATIAFGIRNVPDRALALRELARVVRPGGRVAVLELSEPRGLFLGRMARFHVHHVVPFLGALLSGSKEYRYLQRSIAAFPAPEVFADTMRAAGLEVLSVSRLTFGVCCLYVATPSKRGAGA